MINKANFNKMVQYKDEINNCNFIHCSHWDVKKKLMQNYNFEDTQKDITANYFELLRSLLSWVTEKQQNTEDRLSDFEARTSRIFSRVVALNS
jgi:flagellar hook-basal body complex protein FliE